MLQDRTWPTLTTQESSRSSKAAATQRRLNRSPVWSIGFFLVYVLFVFLLLTTTVVDGCANDAYRCSNGRCVERHLVNNSVNDCGDNSDEAAFPCRYPLFSCRSNRCTLMDWVLDGKDDCHDGSDEAKLIGTPCTMAVLCCFCSNYVPHSECGQDGVCRCSDGYYSNRLGTACIRRGLGDICVESRDCSVSVEHSKCLSSVSSEPETDVISQTCVCDVGYYTDDKFTCKPREIGDRCSTDVDCNAVVSNTRCHDNTCQCLPRYYSMSPTHCVIRRLGGQCDSDKQCTEVIDGQTFCNTSLQAAGRCDCLPGYRHRGDRNACVLRQIGQRCFRDDDCKAAVNVALCGLTGRCECPRSHLLTRRTECRPRWPGEICLVDDDCQSAVNSTVCVAQRCACIYDHVWNSAAQSCQYDGRDSHVEAVGKVLLAGVAVLAAVDVIVVGCLIWHGIWMLQKTIERSRLRKKSSLDDLVWKSTTC